MQIPDLLCNCQCIFVVLDRFFCLPKIAVYQPEISEVFSFAAPISNRPYNHKRIFIVLDRSLDLPEIAVCIPEISEGISFTTPILNLP